jgi:AcrR family transcriptional regulator
MAGTLQASRRRLAAAARQEEILAAATALLATSGFNAVSLDAFANAAGISKAGLLHHFPSKDALLAAVLERRDELDAAAVLDAGRRRYGDPRQARQAFAALVERNLHQPAIMRLYTVLSAEALDPAHPAHEFFQRRLGWARSYLAELLLPWHPRPALAAVEVLAFLDGLQLMWLRDPSIDYLAQADAFAKRLFVL